MCRSSMLSNLCLYHWQFLQESVMLPSLSLFIDLESVFWLEPDYLTCFT